MFHFRNKRLIVLLFLLGFIGAAAIIAHIFVSDHQEATGGVALLDHVFDIVLAFILTITLSAVGHSVTERLRLRFINVAEEIGFSLFVGAGVVGLAVLLLGLGGWLRPIPVSLLIAICIFVSRGSWMRLVNLVKETIQSLAYDREARVVAAIYACLIFLFVLRAAGVPTAPDELIYHLPVTRSFVQRGAVYALFDNSLGNFPFLIHMIYAVCLLTSSDIAPRLISLFLAVGTSFAIFGFCTRYLNRRIAAVAIFAFFGAGMMVEVAVTSRIDVSLAGMLFLCTYAMVNYLDTGQQGWLWVSALLAGFSLGIKHTAILWLGFIALMYLVHSLVINRNGVLPVLRTGFMYALLAFAIASPWYIKNYEWFHNPVYPLLTGEVAEFGANGIRYFDANDEQRLDAHFVAARSEMPEIVKAQENELAEQINSRIQRHPLRWWEFFLKPSNYLMAEPYQYPNYLFLIIPLLVSLKKPKWILWLLLLSLGFVFAVTWTSWIARYLVPAYPALTIIASYTLVELSKRLKLRFASLEKLYVYAVAVALAVIVASSIRAMNTFNTVRYLAGSASRQEIESQFPYYQPIHFINSQLPSNARILTIGAQQTYGIEREHLTDESWFTTKWRRVLIRNSSLEQVNEDLKRQGFTHVLYSDGLFKFAAWMGTRGTGGTEMISVNEVGNSEERLRLGPEYQLLRNWSTFTMYKTKFLETVYSDQNGYEILKIK
jgi:4-amino-4-deoxy-L-arabinose transferase-like glycosyltransferase